MMVVYFDAVVNSLSCGVACPRCGASVGIVGTVYRGKITNSVECDCALFSQWNVKRVRAGSLVLYDVFTSRDLSEVRS